MLTPHVATFPFVEIGKSGFKSLTNEENTRSVPGLNLILEVHEYPHICHVSVKCRTENKGNGKSVDLPLRGPNMTAISYHKAFSYCLRVLRELAN